MKVQISKLENLLGEERNKIEEEMPDKNNQVEDSLRKEELSQREIKQLKGEMEERKKKFYA
jgi:hypothetical protein